MCGRFTLTLEISRLQQKLGFNEIPPDWSPRFNIAPSQNVLVVSDVTKPKVELIRWGLVPSWAKDISIGNQLINARSETLSEKPSFKQAFARRRCLILSDGFYEWKRMPGKKPSSIPYYFQLVDKSPFAFAGLWELWKTPEGEELKSCIIITCPANACVTPIHERMPVIFTPKTWGNWLEDRSLEELKTMLVPYPSEEMKTYQVSGLVNSPAQDSEKCIEPL